MTPPAASSAVSHNTAIVGAIATVATMGIGLSLSIPLLSVRMEAAGYSASAIGLQTAMGGIATLFAAPLVPPLARRLGMRLLLLLAIATGIACLLAFGFVDDLLWWYPLRLIYGAALTAIFVAGEFSINVLAPEHMRGRVLGIYGAALSLGFAAGPLLLGFTGVAGMLPFLAGAALFALAAAPAVVAGGATPALEGGDRGGALAFLFRSPSATFGAMIFGAIETGVMGLLPVYALRNGADAVEGTRLVGMVFFGSVLFQIPLGYLSDKMDRRVLLLAIALIALGGVLAWPLLAHDWTGFAALLFVWGGVTGGLYPVALAHLGSRYSGADLASANAAFVMLYSLGMLIAPPLLGRGLDWWNPHGFVAGLATLLALYAALVAMRLRAGAR